MIGIKTTFRPVIKKNRVKNDRNIFEFPLKYFHKFRIFSLFPALVFSFLVQKNKERENSKFLLLFSNLSFNAIIITYPVFR